MTTMKPYVLRSYKVYKINVLFANNNGMQDHVLSILNSHAMH